MAILAATPLAASYIATPAYGSGVIIDPAVPDPKDADGDGAVFTGVIVDPLNSQQVESIEGPTLLQAEEQNGNNQQEAGVIVGAKPQITKIGDDGGGDCPPDDDVGVC